MSGQSTSVEGHEPWGRDTEGHERCVCGFRYPCPDVRAAPAELTDDERAVVRMLTVGCAVWERLPEGTGRDEVRGGIVCEIRRDDDDRRVFVTAFSHHGRLQFLELDEDQVDPRYAELPNSAHIRSLARRMDAEASRGKGVVDGWELLLRKRALALSESIA